MFENKIMMKSGLQPLNICDILFCTVLSRNAAHLAPQKEIIYPFTRPGVAEAVLQTPPSFNNSLIAHSSFVNLSSKQGISQTVRARELKF